MTDRVSALRRLRVGAVLLCSSNALFAVLTLALHRWGYAAFNVVGTAFCAWGAGAATRSIRTLRAVAA